MTSDQPSEIQKLLMQLRGTPQAPGPAPQPPTLTPPSVVDPDVAMQAQRNSAMVGGLQSLGEGIVNSVRSPNWYMMQHGIQPQRADLSGAFAPAKQVAMAPFERAALEAANANTQSQFGNQQKMMGYQQNQQNFQTAAGIAGQGAMGNLSLKIAQMQADAMKNRLNRFTGNEPSIAAGIPALRERLLQMDDARSRHDLGPLLRYAAPTGLIDRAQNLLGMDSNDPDPTNLATDAQTVSSAGEYLGKEYMRLVTPGRSPTPQQQASFGKGVVPGMDPAETDQSYENKAQNIWNDLNKREALLYQNRGMDPPTQTEWGAHRQPRTAQGDYQTPQQGGDKPAGRSDAMGNAAQAPPGRPANIHAIVQRNRRGAR